MMITEAMTEYLTVLFDADDHICIAKSVYSNHTRPLSEVLQGDTNYEFVCVNAFRPGTTRAQRNVGVYRNFIIEFDEVPLKEQRKLVEKLGLPHSTQVWSGSKSVHFVISLETPLNSRDEWERISRWIYSVVEPHGADSACKNIDRFTRVGGGHRITKNKTQDLIETRGRVPNEILMAWLRQYPEPRAPRLRHTTGATAHNISLFGEEYDESFRGKISKETIKFAKSGGPKGDRHYRLFKAACDMRDQRYPLDEALVFLLTKLRDRYIMEDREEEMWKHENTVSDAYQNYPPNPPRF
jgi:hypothetical protein